MSMTIRSLEARDLHALAELYYQFWNEESDVQKMEAKFAELQNNSAYILLCAVENDELVGSVMGIVCEELYGKCESFLVLENMIIDRRCRRKGVGTFLLAELERRARARGCTQIILVTETDRKDACRFYEAMGFHPNANKGYKKKYNFTEI